MDEVRASFATYGDMEINSVTKLQDLPVVLDKAFRIYPPAPFTSPRVLLLGGTVIGGKFVAGGTVVGAIQYSCNQDPRNFHEPQKLLPEKWLPQKLHAVVGVSAAMFTPTSAVFRNRLGMGLEIVTT